MKRIPWYKSIRVIIPLALCLLVMVPVLIFVRISYNISRQAAMQDAIRSIDNDLNNKAHSLDLLLEDVTQFGITLSSDGEILHLIRAYTDADPSEKELARSRLTLELVQKQFQLRSLSTIYLAQENASVLLSTIPARKTIPVEAADGKSIYDAYMDRYVDRIRWGSVPPQGGGLLYFKPVHPDGDVPSSSLIFSIKRSYIQTILSQPAYASAEIVITDANGDVRLTQRGSTAVDAERFQEALDKRWQNGSYTASFNGEEYLIVYYTSFNSNWKYIECVRTADVFQNQSPLGYNIAALIAAGILAAFLGSWLTTRIVLRPVDHVLKGMQRIEQGDLTPQDYPTSDNEMGMLVNGFHDMTDQLKTMIDRNYAQRILTKEAQLRMLQSQMDEHFLYNTLNVVVNILRSGNAERAEEILDLLAKFYRMTLSGGKHQLQVREVVDIIKYYLLLQKVRFGDRLTVRIQVDEDIEDCYVVKYLFQPIVENSIQHGLESKLGNCTIDIRFLRQNDQLYFETTDNGIGMSDDELEKLYRNITDTESESSFALRNINSQIQLTYGPDHQLQIESRPGKGTKVFFSIPLVRELNNE